ncbi:hypothetical protein TNCV_1420381 [Trichonephila clavipes]|nr:hypothetical protein TNCV_1420381 [Trichonephila clavipes]
MFESSSYVNSTPLAHADTSRDVLPRGGTSHADHSNRLPVTGSTTTICSSSSGGSSLQAERVDRSLWFQQAGHACCHHSVDRLMCTFDGDGVALDLCCESPKILANPTKWWLSPQVFLVVKLEVKWTGGLWSPTRSIQNIRICQKIRKPCHSKQRCVAGPQTVSSHNAKVKTCDFECRL